MGRVLDRPLLNSGTVTLDDNKMSTAVTANGAITNESGGTFNFEVADGLAASGTPATFTNQGTITVTPTSTTTAGLAVPVTNTGTVSVAIGHAWGRRRPSPIRER